ncbi:hypothetical protein, partial [Corynebacterium diphtheriae]|uniref:hypothetical protein n=3 Tax=Corynebacterium diphtheriae TaxID=1717 RepID=UPI000DD02CE1
KTGRAGLPLIDRPARYRGESYLRMADGDYRMTDSELRMLEVNKREAVNYDAVVVEGTSVDDLDATLVKDFLAQIRVTSSWLRQVENDEELLRLLAVTTAGRMAAFTDWKPLMVPFQRCCNQQWSGWLAVWERFVATR